MGWTWHASRTPAKGIHNLDWPIPPAKAHSYHFMYLHPHNIPNSPFSVTVISLDQTSLMRCNSLQIISTALSHRSMGWTSGDGAHFKGRDARWRMGCSTSRERFVSHESRFRLRFVQIRLMTSYKLRLYRPTRLASGTSSTLLSRNLGCSNEKSVSSVDHHY